MRTKDVAHWMRLYLSHIPFFISDNIHFFPMPHTLICIEAALFRHGRYYRNRATLLRRFMYVCMFVRVMHWFSDFRTNDNHEWQT